LSTVKTLVSVWLGGNSPEHWISFKSAMFVLIFLDRERFEVSAQYIHPDGSFATPTELLTTIDEFFVRNQVLLFLESDQVGDWMSRLRRAALAEQPARPDVLFPVFHGRLGEDGGFQGLAETLGIPYVGCNFVGSVLGMDKVLTKLAAGHSGLATTFGLEVSRSSRESSPEAFEGEVLKTLQSNGVNFPMFVKPVRLGSSIGVNRVRDLEELHRALVEAFEYDDLVLIEAEVRGIEYAVGVIGHQDQLESSVVVEYTSAPENFGYDSKYGPQSLPDIIPARLSPEDMQTMKRFAEAVFRALEMEGICRVDSFWDTRTGRPLLNEVNTMPGLNASSPFVLAWEVSGVSKKALLTRMVELALEPSRGR